MVDLSLSLEILSSPLAPAVAALCGCACVRMPAGRRRPGFHFPGVDFSTTNCSLDIGFTAIHRLVYVDNYDNIGCMRLHST